MNDPVMYFWIATAAIILLVDLWAIVSVLRSDKSDATKVMWSLILVVLPIVGLAIWEWPGRVGSSVAPGRLHPNTAKGRRAA